MAKDQITLDAGTITGRGNTLNPFLILAGAADIDGRTDATWRQRLQLPLHGRHSRGGAGHAAALAAPG
jgi:hypothetical protein